MRIISATLIVKRLLLAAVVLAAIAMIAAVAARVVSGGAKPAPSAPAPPAPRAQPSGHYSGAVQYDLLAKLLADDRRQTQGQWRQELVDSRGAFRVASQGHPLLRWPAPDFTLLDADGKSWSLRQQLRRGPVVLVFYLGYNCPACVHDLFVLDADRERFRELGVALAAISGDTPETTRSRAEQFGALHFPLLFDPRHATAALYSVYRPRTASQAEEMLHATFIVRGDGIIAWAYSQAVSPFANDKALLAELIDLPSNGPLNPAPSSARTLSKELP